MYYYLHNKLSVECDKLCRAETSAELKECLVCCGLAWQPCMGGFFAFLISLVILDLVFWVRYDILKLSSGVIV